MTLSAAVWLIWWLLIGLLIAACCGLNNAPGEDQP
jgi:hypothetical protein